MYQAAGPLLREALLSTHKRIEALAWVINHSVDIERLVLARECLLTLFDKNPEEKKIQLMIQKANTKIRLKD